MNATAAFPYTPGKLVPERHGRLVDDLSRIARESGIAERDITGHDYALTPDEITYLLGYRRASREGRCGLVYVGRHDPPVLSRCRSVAGALVRNFIEVRMMARAELVSHLMGEARVPPDACVICPDLTTEGVTTGVRRMLSSWVTSRALRGHQTVFGVPGMKDLADLFGEASAVLDHFTILRGVEY